MASFQCKRPAGQESFSALTKIDWEVESLFILLSIAASWGGGKCGRVHGIIQRLVKVVLREYSHRGVTRELCVDRDVGVEHKSVVFLNVSTQAV